MITLKDIAKRAGTSVAIVSKVLNGSRTTAAVRPDLRERVLNVAKKLGYQPNLLAQGLAKGKTFTIGIVFTYPPLAFMGNFMVSQVISGIWDKARRAGYNIFLKAPKSNKSGFFPPIDDLRGRVDGIIALGPVRSDDKELVKWSNVDVPLVLLGTHPEFCGYSVDYDNEGGAYLATKYLLRQGHRDIAFVGGGLENTFMEDRLKGYKRALEERAIPLREELIKLTSWRGSDGYRAAKELMALPQPPTAIFICIGEHLRGVFEAVKEKGLKVPEDVALLSFDRLPEDFVIDIPLLSLDTFPYKVGQLGTMVLLNIIQGKLVHEQTIKIPVRRVVEIGKKGERR
jgi:LacI family transcriptional regulator